MSPIKLTIYFIICVTLFIIGYDIWAYSNNVSNALDTISGRMKIWGRESLILPYAWGVLGGHFWGWMNGKLLGSVNFKFDDPKVGIALLVSSALVVVISDLFLKKQGIYVWPWLLIFPGVVAGMLFWSQGQG